MGALAHSDRTALGWLDEAAPGRPRLTPARRVRPTERRQAGWNVLAEELVAFPPAAELTAGRQRHRAVHRPELVKDAHAVSNNADRTRLAGSTTTWDDELTSRRAMSRAAAVKSVARREADRSISARPRQVAPKSRGLRRLLPGAATLAVLMSIWLGAGALSTLHRPVLTLPAAAVKVSGGYLYVARPGDTLWAIASRLQPGGDPRPLVAELEQQLHGAQLVAGDRLTLP